MAATILTDELINRLHPFVNYPAPFEEGIRTLLTGPGGS